MAAATNTIEALTNQEYQFGFVTNIEAEFVPRGLNEDIVRLVSAKKSVTSLRECAAPWNFPPTFG